MAEAASLSVSITGDASGLISSLGEADAALANVGASANKIMSEFNGKEAKIRLTALDNTAAGVASARSNINSLKDRTVTVSVRYNVLGMPKLASGTRSAREGLAVVNDEKGARDPRELIEHDGRFIMFSGRDVTVPLSRGDKVYTADETKSIMAGLGLPHYASGKNNGEFEIKKADISRYKKSSDAWIKYQTEAADMSIDEQIAAYKRQAETYNAMVSDMVNGAVYSAEELKEIWDDFYDYKADVDLKVAKLEKERNDDVYKKWQSDAKNWKKIRDTYDDWEEAGDSPVKFYERSMERIREMFEGGFIDWQTYRDDTMNAALSLYGAKSDAADELLARQKAYIQSTKRQFDSEEKALAEKWEVEDRNADKAEIERGLNVFRGAVTQRGIDKYKSLQDEMKKIRREEEMYRLQKTHTETLTELEESYDKVEENKKYLLTVIEKSGLNVENIVGGMDRDIRGMQSTIESLFRQTINAIKALSITSNSFSDNRNINISAGSSSDVVDALKNRVGISLAHGSYY